MNEQQALAKMVSPGMKRPGKPRGGVIQIWVTRACDLSCFGCTQGSNLRAGPDGWQYMTPPQFEQACESLVDYFGIVGVFGGNPAISPYFEDYCAILRRYIPKERCGLWCNHPRGHGRAMRDTFNPAVSNLNVHLVQAAYDEFVRDWPECRPFGLHQDSRHAPPYVALQDMEDLTEGQRWDMIADCDINKHWSAMIGVFRGELRAWFCEIAGAQAMLHQHEPDYPDTGLDPTVRYRVEPATGVPLKWWELPMEQFADQVRHHCHGCGVPLRGYGELAQGGSGKEQVSATHAAVYQPKKRDRPVELVQLTTQLGEKRVGKFTHYLQNGRK